MDGRGGLVDSSGGVGVMVFVGAGEAAGGRRSIVWPGLWAGSLGGWVVAL